MRTFENIELLNQELNPFYVYFFGMGQQGFKGCIYVYSRLSQLVRLQVKEGVLFVFSLLCSLPCSTLVYALCALCAPF